MTGRSHRMPRNSIVVLSEKSFTRKDRDGSNRRIVAVDDDQEATRQGSLLQVLRDLDDFQDEDEEDSSQQDAVQGEPKKVEPGLLLGEEEQEKKQKRRVRFSTAHIYEHPYIAGDNPSCSSGTPLTIDWTCIARRVEPVRAVEPLESSDASTAASSSSRSYMEMRVPAHVREKLLREQGYSRDDLIKLTRPVNVARGQRVRTNETKSLEPIQEALQRAKRGIRKLALSKEDRQERERLKQWRAPANLKKSSSGQDLRPASTEAMKKSRSFPSSQESLSTSNTSGTRSNASWSLPLLRSCSPIKRRSVPEYVDDSRTSNSSSVCSGRTTQASSIAI